MAKQPPKKVVVVKPKPKGFLESVKEKIGSGMGYIDSVMQAHPAIPNSRGFQQPSPAAVRAATKPKK